MSRNPFYLRTSDGYEIDLVLQWGSRRWAVEIELTSDPSVEMVRRLRKAADMIGAERAILLCRKPEVVESTDVLVTHPADWIRRLTTQTGDRA